ncbi:MAG: NUMOD4 motif protein [Candidatus Dependentiae bacterium ADurb.Bin331]|nr:MAG: NUMOD4 motif protein [Candidatus Dependentiae bacterium ADurb.Bin331]
MKLSNINIAEYWKTIPNFYDKYAISNLGRIKKNINEHILRPHYHKKGHVTVRLYKDDREYNFYLKDLVLGVFNEFKNLPIGFINGDYSDCSLGNIYYVSSLICDDVPVVKFDDEIWKEHPEQQLLMISNYGEVYSKGRYVRSKNGWRKKGGKILKSQVDFDGYITIRFQNKNYKVHRLVLETFKQRSQLSVNHINGIKKDNRLFNLEYTSHSENSLHSIRIGLRKVKFSDGVKNEIVRLYQLGMSKKRISEEFRTNMGTIQRLIPKTMIVKNKKKNIAKQKKPKIMRISDFAQIKDLSGEIWKEIPGFEGRYKASNLGRIKSVERIVIERRTGTHRIKKAIILRPAIDNLGYQKIRLYKQHGNSKTYRVHRVILSTFKGSQILECNHIDGNKLNNRIENLVYCARVENMKHARKSGLVKNIEKGSQRYNSKLKEVDVINIRKLIKNKKASCKELALRFQVSYRCIKQIVLRKSWKHVFLLPE